MGSRGAGVVVAWVLGLVGCAAPQVEAPKERLGWTAEAPAPTRFDPQAIAAAHPADRECESVARAYQATNREQAWAVLKACLEVHPFTDIRLLLSGPWDPELAGPDGAEVIARVVANRGGDFATDLSIVRKSHHNPGLLSVDEALARPGPNKGKLVALRASVGTLEAKGAIVHLFEERVGGGKGDQLYDVYVTRSRKVFAVEAGETMETHVEDTGIEVVGQVREPSPLLAKGKRLVVLGRFQGPHHGEEETSVADVVILKAFPVSEQSAY